MKKSLLTLITLLGVAQINTAPGPGALVPVVPGPVVVQQANGQSDFNFLLQTVIRKRINGYTVSATEANKAQKAAEQAYALTKIDNWSELTVTQLNAIGFAALVEAISSLQKTDQDHILGDSKAKTVIKPLVTFAELQKLANMTAPSWVSENPIKSLVALGGIAAITNAVRNTEGTIDASQGFGTTALLAATVYALYNYKSVLARLKTFNTDIRSFGRKTMDNVKSFKLSDLHEYVVPGALVVGAIALDASVRKEKSMWHRTHKNGVTDLPFAIGDFGKASVNGIARFIGQGFRTPVVLTPAELQKARQDKELKDKQAILAKLQGKDVPAQTQGQLDYSAEITKLDKEIALADKQQKLEFRKADRAQKLEDRKADRAQILENIKEQKEDLRAQLQQDKELADINREIYAMEHPAQPSFWNSFSEKKPVELSDLD